VHDEVRELHADRPLPVDHHLDHGALRQQVGALDRLGRDLELLVALLVHEDHAIALAVQVLHGAMANLGDG
jgi:hypothetical protein